MKVAVIGASSYVGARIFVDLKAAGFETIGTFNTKQILPDLAQLDIRDAAAVTSYLSSEKPDVVILGAAYSNQAACEKDPVGAEQVNVQGAANVVAASDSIGAHVVYLSSEAAFSSNEYGISKRRAEEVVRSAKIPSLIVQLGMCFGMSPNRENDRPHNRLLRAIEKKGKAEFDGSSKFHITYLPHLSRILIELLKREHWNDTIPVICSEPQSRYEIARSALAHYGIEVIALSKGPSAEPAPITERKLSELRLETLKSSDMLRQLSESIEQAI